VRSKASTNQLNLPHGTKTKPDMLKDGEQPESVVSVRLVCVILSVASSSSGTMGPAPIGVHCLFCNEFPSSAILGQTVQLQSYTS